MRTAWLERSASIPKGRTSRRASLWQKDGPLGLSSGGARGVDVGSSTGKNDTGQTESRKRQVGLLGVPPETGILGTDPPGSFGALIYRLEKGRDEAATLGWRAKDRERTRIGEEPLWLAEIRDIHK